MAASHIFDTMDADHNGEISKHEIISFANSHSLNVAKLIKALSVEGKYTVNKTLFIGKYEEGVMPDPNPNPNPNPNPKASTRRV